MTGPVPTADARPSTSLATRRLPPVAELTVGSMGLAIVGGIYLAAHLPHRADLAPAVGLLAAGGALLAISVVLLARVRPFAWDVFFRVGRWAVLAYAVIAGMLEYIFVLDGTRGALLAVLTLTLLLFALDVPLLFAFSVARYQDPGDADPRATGYEGPPYERHGQMAG